MSERSHTEQKLHIKDLLREHMGPDNAISMVDIYLKVNGWPVAPHKKYDQTRPIRSFIELLRHEGCPIGIKDGKNGGYFWARNSRDLEPTVRKFHARAMSSLKQMSALKNIPFSDLIRQLEFEYKQELSIPSG